MKFILITPAHEIYATVILKRWIRIADAVLLRNCCYAVAAEAGGFVARFWFASGNQPETNNQEQPVA